MHSDAYTESDSIYKTRGVNPRGFLLTRGEKIHTNTKRW